MPSPAYTTWTTWLADSQALNAVRAGASTGALAPDQEEALGRATMVALVAAFQAYVEALFEATASWLTGSELAVDRLRARHIEGRAGGRRFNNPDPDAVRSLFDQVFDVFLPGADIWDSVRVGNRTAAGTQAMLRGRLQERHMIAHGKERVSLSFSDVRERIQEFEGLVSQLDARAAAIVRSRTGRTPW